MAVVLYWRERLAARNPFYLEGNRVEGLTQFARIDDTWPKAIAKKTMYLDYLAWFERKYLPQFDGVEYYKDFPDALPCAANKLTFFATVGLYLYVVSNSQQTRTYKVQEKKPHEGRYVLVKAKRNFVRLCEWEEHVALFELATGISVASGDKVEITGEAMAVVSEAARITIKRLRINREALDRAMGKGEGG